MFDREFHIVGVRAHTERIPESRPSHRGSHPHALGDIGERAVAIVPIQGVAKRARWLIEIARAAVDEFPANASYWVACLLAVTGQPDTAIDALEEGLIKGGWWPPLMLTMDPDLEPIRGSNRFVNVVARSERAWKQAFKAAPEADIYPPTIQPSGEGGGANSRAKAGSSRPSASQSPERGRSVPDPNG